MRWGAAPHLNAALDWITAEDFDPTTTVVLPEGGSSWDGPPGTARVIESGTHRMELEVSSTVPGVLVLQRAFLPIYRARAILAQLTVSVRTGGFFQREDLQYVATFFDLLHMMEFDELLITDGKTWTHRVDFIK